VAPNGWQNLLKDYSGDEMLSVKELAKLLSMGPNGLGRENALLLARFVIEPRDKAQVADTPYAECGVEGVNARLKSAVCESHDCAFDETTTAKITHAGLSVSWIVLRFVEAEWKARKFASAFEFEGREGQ
jgi:hypothetical protein